MNWLQLYHVSLSVCLSVFMSVCPSYLGCDELLASDLVGLVKHDARPLRQVLLLHRRLVHTSGL